MPNRQLSKTELKDLFQPLHELVTARLKELSGNNDQLLWALRRKLAKSLSYGERGTPIHRRRIKALKRAEQHGLCAICCKQLPKLDCILDRFEAMHGYTVENTRLLCRECDFKVQSERKFA
jgi:ribosomal protein L44E